MNWALLTVLSASRGQWGCQRCSRSYVCPNPKLETYSGYDSDWMEELIEFASTCGFQHLLDDEERW